MDGPRTENSLTGTLGDEPRETVRLAQRKIHHLLDSEGEGRDFRYLPRLRAPFRLDEPILVTEKVDGSTMQASRGNPWKRFDLFSKGDPTKRLVDEASRYELRPCSSDDPALRWLLASFEAFKPEFDNFGREYPERWVYFEALGSKIGARYKDLDPTVRVFDVSEGGVFLPFMQTLEAAKKCHLPVVASRAVTFGDLANLLNTLRLDVSTDPSLTQHELEGWVLRQQSANGNTFEEIVAKIRVKDLQKLES